MLKLIDFSFGLTLVTTTWLVLRHSVGATLRRTPWPVAALDGLVPLLGYLLMVMGTARPMVSMLPPIAAMAGLILTDHVKRDMLREPVVFADRAELLEVIRHPRLYLPFAGTELVVGVVLAMLMGIAGLVWLEPGLFHWHVWSLPVAVTLAVACFWVPAQKPFLGWLAERYARLPVTRDPAQDMTQFGMLACFVIHATLARAERSKRQAMAGLVAAGRPLPALPTPPKAGPIVIVQSESWFDVRRLHADLRGWLPEYEIMAQQAAQTGLLDVPCWGANTIRSEFTVLTGIDDQQLGLDRFNPYASFARTDLPSLARHAQAAGYRTVCVHPFDLSFYGRRRVLPCLGFDELIGPEAFRTAPRAGEWVSDQAVAEAVIQHLDHSDGRVLVFAITMQAHSPYDGPSQPGELAALPAALRQVPGGDELARYLSRLREASAMLPMLRNALHNHAEKGHGHGWLAVYGDHQPALPRAFEALGLTDPRTDYMLWTTHKMPAANAQPQNLAAHQLGATLMTQIAQAARAQDPAHDHVSPSGSRGQ